MKRVAFGLSLAIGCVAWAVPLGAQQDELRSRVSWLEANAVRLRSIDPADTDFTDLEPLVESIGDARIVMLGEQTHGDGATFHAKARIIQFLHERLGFDVLAFEGGFYEMPKVWAELMRGGEALPTFQGALAGVWAESEQVRPLLEYVGEKSRTGDPLVIAGFDSQPRSASRESLVTELSAVAAELEPALVSGEAGEAVRAALDSLIGGAYYAAQISSTQHRRITDWLSALALEIETTTRQRSDAELGHWRQVIESLAAHTDAMATWDPDDGQEFGNIRDEQMARNLLWLARERFADRKIIVWAATFHIMRHHRTIDRGGGASYDGVTVMGHNVWQELGEQMYAVGFTAHGGSWGWYNGDPQDLPAPPPRSIEDLFGRTTIDNAFLDFRHLPAGGDWLTQRLMMRPLGNRPMEANWTEVLDAVVFTRTMVPSTPSSR